MHFDGESDLVSDFVKRKKETKVWRECVCVCVCARVEVIIHASMAVRSFKENNQIEMVVRPVPAPALPPPPPLPPLCGNSLASCASSAAFRSAALRALF